MNNLSDDQKVRMQRSIEHDMERKKYLNMLEAIEALQKNKNEDEQNKIIMKSIKLFYDSIPEQPRYDTVNDVIENLSLSKKIDLIKQLCYEAVNYDFCLYVSSGSHSITSAKLYESLT